MTNSAADGVRYTMSISHAARDQLNALASRFNITQGEVIEVLLARCDVDGHAEAFKKVRQDKLAARAQRRAELATLRQLPPEELARLVSIANTNNPTGPKA